PLRSTLFPYTTLFRSWGVSCGFSGDDAPVFQGLDLVGAQADVAQHGVGVLPDAQRRIAAVPARGARQLGDDAGHGQGAAIVQPQDRKSTRLNSSHVAI